MKIFKSVFILSLFVFGGLCDIKEDKHYWRELAQRELRDALSYSWNTNLAKNVVVFVGDGMGPNTVTASRIYRNGEDSYLAWERFPHVGLLKTYNTDKQTPDSASTATALFCGVKTNYKVHAVDVNVVIDDCEASLRTDNRVDSIISWAQKAGKNTGFVTTTRITHATPAPLYAHGPNRKWECESMMPKEAANCKDIARQLVENEPGKNLKVIMGGGRQTMQTQINETEKDPIDMWTGRRKDGRDLINEWAADKKDRGAAYRVVQNNEELSDVDFEATEFLLGVFANGHLQMDYARDKGAKGQPSLEEMTRAALKILKKSSNGYLLVVEGGLIDFAHHRGYAAQALRETVRFSDAINATLEMIDVEETLLIVTSDHTHALTFNGYSKRGANILGIAEKSKVDNISFTTLAYSSGGPNNYAYKIVEVDGTNKSVRIDPSESDTTQFTYSQQASIITDEAHHGGGDVPVYAIGPYAHLLHTTHEQNFVAEVIAYAAKIGRYANHSSTSHPWYIIWLTNLIGFFQTIKTLLQI